MSILYNTFTGGAGEELAKIYLEERGFLFIEANFNTRVGEIDLIMKKDRTLYFIEAKTRNNVLFGYPEESVTKEKITKIHKTILYYLRQTNCFSGYNKQIFVVSILYYSTERQPEIRFFEI